MIIQRRSFFGSVAAMLGGMFARGRQPDAAKPGPRVCRLTLERLWDHKEVAACDIPVGGMVGIEAGKDWLREIASEQDPANPVLLVARLDEASDCGQPDDSWVRIHDEPGPQFPPFKHVAAAASWSDFVEIAGITRDGTSFVGYARWARAGGFGWWLADHVDPIPVTHPGAYVTRWRALQVFKENVNAV